MNWRWWIVGVAECGCGADEWGDVRLDISREYLGVKFRPTIIADAQNLPFKNGSFKITKASHVIEHLENPAKALEEWVRVTREKLIIKFPTEKDIQPYIISSFVSFNLPRLLHEYRMIKRRLHKWIISLNAITKFLEMHGWKCTITKGTQCLFNILESRKLRPFKRLVKYLPRITHEYIIVASKERWNFEDCWSSCFEFVLAGSALTAQYIRNTYKPE